jgi:hypothetical protein
MINRCVDKGNSTKTEKLARKIIWRNIFVVGRLLTFFLVDRNNGGLTELLNLWLQRILPEIPSNWNLELR